MRKIKIMQVIYILKRGAGVEQLALDLSTHFTNDSFETCVVGFKSGSLMGKLKDRGIQVFSLDKETGFDLKFVDRFNSLITQIKPHIIHAHTLSPNFWSILLGHHLHNTIIISTVHTIVRKKAVYKPFYDYVNFFSDQIVAVSEKVKNTYAESFKLNENRIKVVYSGVGSPSNHLQPDELQRLKKDLKLNPMLRTVISVGRIEEPKGYEYLIEAGHFLAQKGINLNFLVVGEGHLKNELILMARQLGLGKRFIFTGYRSDVSNLIQTADLAVMSSVREGFSIALLEFMAMGMPLVVTDVGGNREAITDEVSGIIIPPANPRALTKGIERILNEPRLADRLGTEARHVYEQKFTSEQMLQRYEELYTALLNNEP